MDEELLTLEAELKRLRPAAPSPATEAHITRELRPSSRRIGALQWAWFALPVAAALAIAFVVIAPRRLAPAIASERAVPATFKPVAAENLLLTSHDEGYVTLSDGTQARRVRQTYVDTITWRNSVSNASLQWSLPREEVRVVPITFQ